MSEIYSNVKFRENPSSGSRLLYDNGRRDGRTAVTKLTVAYRNFSRHRLKVNILCKGTWNVSSRLQKAGNV